MPLEAHGGEGDSNARGNFTSLSFPESQDPSNRSSWRPRVSAHQPRGRDLEEQGYLASDEGSSFPATTEMSKHPRFNWRVFCYLRQRHMILMGGIFLILLSLVYSVRDSSGDILESQQPHHDQQLLHPSSPSLSSSSLSQEQALSEVEAEEEEEEEVEEEVLGTGLSGEVEEEDPAVEDWVLGASSSPPPAEAADVDEVVEQEDEEEAVRMAATAQQEVDDARRQAASRIKNKGSYTVDSMKAAYEATEKDPAKLREINRERKAAAHAAIMHSWKGYREFAWGADELLPESKEGKTWFGLGLTLIDSLDLLWLAGEKEEFAAAAKWVEEELNTATDAAEVNVFEVTIRVMGGLLSAYHYSKEDVFLRKAKEIGMNMKAAFNSPSGVPFSDANLATKEAYAPRGAPDSSTSEATSIQMEYKYLAYLMDDPDLYELAEKSMHAVDAARQQLPADMKALPPMYINANSGAFLQGSTTTLGARGDSYYEYLLKQWLLTGKKETSYLNKYIEAVDAIKEHLLAYSYPHGLAFIGELLSGRRFSPKMDHLVCFLPGTLALGYMHGCDESHLELAKELMLTCYSLYNSTSTGLSPEIAYFNMEESGGKHDIIIQPRDTHNILRPETVESLFYLHQATEHNPVYQEWGWKIFTAFETYSKVDTGGYSGLQNVQDVNGPRMNKMESFWMGETLKYFYLLFSSGEGGEDLVPLDRYVFNTEAHPFPMFSPPWMMHEDKEEWDEEDEERKRIARLDAEGGYVSSL